MFKKNPQILFSFLPLLLSACVTSNPPPSYKPLLESSWRETGVFSYREKDQGFSASYIWDNHKQHYTIQIVGPLGVWRAKLDGTKQCATLTLSNGKVFTASNPETLMQENLQWSIPVNYLEHWLWASPDMTKPYSVKRNAKGEVTQLVQDGWTVNYPEYLGYESYGLPARLVLSQADKKITIVVQNFTVIP